MANETRNTNTTTGYNLDETKRAAAADADRRTSNPDANPDPITHAPGSHPIGTGVGAAAAGAAGAAIGSVVPGVGTVVGGVVGTVVGAVAGGYAGKAVAEAVNPSVEDDYWRNNYHTRPYVSSGTNYEDYQPAYRYGWESRSQHAGRTFDQAENDLSRGWEKAKGKTELTWERAKHATRDAWDRVDSHMHTAGSRSEGVVVNEPRENRGSEFKSDPDRM